MSCACCVCAIADPPLRPIAATAVSAISAAAATNLVLMWCSLRGICKSSLYAETTEEHLIWIKDDPGRVLRLMSHLDSEGHPMSWLRILGAHGAFLSLMTLGLIVTVVGMGAASSPAQALPSYARQTGQTCAFCHTGLPELTPAGREFKLNGYVQGGGQETWIPPVAAMIQGGFTHTSANQPDAVPHFGPNNNFELTQASLFYGGAIWAEQGLGAFIQGTYDGVGRVFSWDNTDIRMARQT